MNQSDSIANLAAALAKAQGEIDARAESKLIHRINRLQRGKFIANGTRPTLEAFSEKIRFGATDCWHWVGTVDSGGYGVLGRRKAHRVSWELHNGSFQEGLDVLHHCDNPPCVNPDHLFLGTALDNVADMYVKGRQAPPPALRGERNPMARTTHAAVHALRTEWAAGGISQRALAKRHGLSVMAVNRIIRRETWI